MERAKEVGIRKVSGAIKTQLIAQFLIESLCISLIAFIMALILAGFSISFFNQVAGKTISTGIFEQSRSIGWLLLLSMGIGLLCRNHIRHGFFPLFNPISSFERKICFRFAGTAVAKDGWTGSSYTISIALTVGVIVVYSQVHFMRSQPLGFTS